MGYEVPKLRHPFVGQYIITSSRTNKPLANYPYQINVSDNRKIQGRTNARGETMIVTTVQAESLELINDKPKPIKTRTLYVAGKDSVELFFEYIDD
ncbi:hypothetical protein B0182_13715 [Moraxella bovis]|uniref:Uncharacterized protein n=1 Tax=Moraxella bovis TaxID=476 RepID=A0A1S9ZSQ2_MORBO|nr:hypothetical protein B0182_13715 [Moraxella bovis]STY90976.1 Uncharacterised protein [Moraxella bovis]